jgi:crotonobetainyl-CoA:carnitine CoA-transferase CaiB-like acyl-CoA transferase
MHDNDLAFTGLKVVDLSQGVAGPHCGMLLAQHGADVIKIEPTTGDWGRAIGRQFGDFSAYNVAFNRGKRSLSVDLKSELGLQTVRTLMQQADVVVENYRPGVLARFGLDHATLVQQNPNVVFVSVTGFGQTGPKSKLPATDSILQSFSGLMSANHDAAGTPQRVGVLVIDVVTGLYAFQAASAALYKRATRGGGKHICVSLMESIGAVQAAKMVEFHLEGAAGQKPGVPVGTFATADGFMTINARRDSHYVALCELLSLPELAADARFKAPADRAANEDALMPPLVESIRAWSNADLSAALMKHDILHATVNDYAGYFADDHVLETGVVSWMEHPSMGEIPVHNIPGLDKPRAGSALAMSPVIGQHSVEVLRELDWTQDAIDAALASGAITAGSLERA